jgi:predicted nucleotidyltransferase component of viral defense system
MNQAVIDMLALYQIQTPEDATNALKEIIQEIALLGLHRADFFEKAAFYGGTALRVLYALPRFSEDLDFTLFKEDAEFSLAPYFAAVERELASYGFKVEVENVEKKMKSEIESAFIKANSKIHFLKIESLKSYEGKIQANEKLQIKFEVDTEPAIGFRFETRYLLRPTSFPIVSLKRPDLFAGKLHALLYRNWKKRIKGRDFYDYVWYLKNSIPVRLPYLREKAIQSGHATGDDLKTAEQLKAALLERFSNIDFEQAKDDIRPFIKDQRELKVWSRPFFEQITDIIQIEN